MSILYDNVERGSLAKQGDPKLWYPALKSIGLIREKEVVRCVAGETTLNPKEANFAVAQPLKVVTEHFLNGKIVIIKRKYFLLMMVCLLSVGSSALKAQVTSGNCGTESRGANLQWSYTSNTLTISGQGDMANSFDIEPNWRETTKALSSPPLSPGRITINIVVKQGVTSIGDFAFYDLSGFHNVAINSLTIPSTIKKIGSGAFKGSTLSSINIPEGVDDIGEEAFTNSGLASVNIPRNLTSIGYEVFKGCTGLKKITLPEGVKSIGIRAFSKSGIESITLPSSVTSIADEAFSGTALKSITFPVGITTIGSNVFSNCVGLTSVIISDGVEDISDGAFSGCTNLTSVSIPASVTSIGERSFSGCNKLESIIIPEGVSRIGSNAFLNCSGLTSVTIPTGIKHIPEGAFQGCMGLTTVNIPEGVTSIGRNAFLGCTELTSVTIPSSVTNIEDGAFRDCINLDIINLSEGLLTLGAGVFWGCIKLTSIDLPAGLTKIGHGAFTYTSLTDITIPACVKEIANLFTNGDDIINSTLKSVSIVDGVSIIAGDAFSNCLGLTSVIIPNSIENIGGRAFAGCSNLASVLISQNAKNIGESTFENCSSLTSIDIPEGVEGVGFKAFANCSALKSVTLPSSLTGLSSNAFMDCFNLTSVYNYVSKPLGTTMFGNTDPDCVLYVLAGSVDAYRNGWWQRMFSSIQPMPTTGLPPRIIVSPRYKTVNTGESASFNVVATGSDLRYQWKKDGIDIQGATFDTYTITGVQPADAGIYSCRVYNDEGDSTSKSVVLSLSPQDWDGSYSQWTKGTGSEDDPYLIENAAQLAYLARSVIDSTNQPYQQPPYGEHIFTYGENTYWKLNTDINLNNIPWTPISIRYIVSASASGNKLFCGHFDGGNHSIYNIRIASKAFVTTPAMDGYNYGAGEYLLCGAGLFGKISGADIRNIRIVSGEISGGYPIYSVGAVVAETSGNSIIVNCHNAVAVSGSGVISGSATTSIVSGGIVGTNSDTLTVINCSNSGEIYAESDATNHVAGGIVGSSSKYVAITDCYNRGIVKGQNGRFDMVSAGILGNGSMAVIINCYNTGRTNHAIANGANVQLTNNYCLNGVSTNHNFNGYETDAAMELPDFARKLGYAFIPDTQPYQNGGYPVHSGLLLETKEATVEVGAASVHGILTLGNSTVAVKQKGFQYRMSVQKDYTSVSVDDLANYNLNELQNGRTYHYRVFVETQSQDTIFGNERTFALAHDGSPEIWNGSNTPWTKGSGTKEDPYLIESAAHLAYLAYVTNRSNGANKNRYGYVYGINVHWKLVSDIDLNNIPWTPVGILNHYFCGHFDGNGYTIRSLYIDYSAGDVVALFGLISDGATIRNITVSTGSVTASGEGAVIAAAAYEGTEIVNCHSAVDVSSKGRAAGIVSYSLGDITNCSNSGKIEGSGAGGIVSYFSGKTLVNCNNTGDVKGSNIGGIAGHIGFATLVSNCRNSGKIEGFGGGFYSSSDMGGIVGHSYRFCTFANCVNKGEIQSSENRSVGGIVGYIDGYIAYGGYDRTIAYRITHCINYGNINVKTGTSVGGIVGIGEADNYDAGGYDHFSDITYSSNYGNIYVRQARADRLAVGGIIGEAETPTPTIISYCSNTGNVKVENELMAWTSRVGGLVGGNYWTSGASYSFNTGDISLTFVRGESNANNRSGGLIGTASRSGKFINCYNTGNVFISQIDTGNKSYKIGDSPVNTYSREFCGGSNNGSIIKTQDEMKSSEFVHALNQKWESISVDALSGSGKERSIAPFGSGFRPDTDLKNNGYPIFNDLDVQTLMATGIKEQQAILNGIFNFDGETVTSMGFEYKLQDDANYRPVLLDVSDSLVSHLLTDLQLDALYQYRAFAVINGNRIQGEIMQFKVPLIHLTGISLEQTKIYIPRGQSIQLGAYTTPINATNKNVSYHSSNPDIVEVSATGILYTKGCGMATVTATTEDGGFTATCDVYSYFYEISDAMEITSSSAKIKVQAILPMACNIYLNCDIKTLMYGFFDEPQEINRMVDINELEPNMEYQYWLTCRSRVGGYGEEEYFVSEKKTFRTLSTVSINPVHQSKTSTLYPNPVKDRLFVESDHPIKKIEICTLSGACIAVKETIGQSIKLSDLPNGTYLVRIYTEKGMVTRKIIKN
jgi:hypothetical protein